ncbi:MAG: ATP-binding protein [Bacillota bacterium]
MGEARGFQSQRELLEAWHRFADNRLESASSLEVLQAWRRCRSLAVDPCRLSLACLSSDDLQERLRRHQGLISHAAPFLDHLTSVLADCPHYVAFSDGQGWILDLRRTADSLAGCDDLLAVGTNWSEQYLGNNGVGTVLVTGKPAVVRGGQHYHRILHGWMELGVPVNGSAGLVGVLAAGVAAPGETPGLLGLMQACVKVIEVPLWFDGSLAQGLSADDLIATAIHDLRNPLTALRAIAQLGTKTAADEGVVRLFNRIIDQVDRLTDLLSQGLAPLKPEALVKANPAAIIEELLAENHELFEQRGIAASFDRQRSAEIPLQPLLFKRAIGNLVTNAIQAMPGGGRLTIKLAQAGRSHLLLSVADTGCGIPEHLRGHVFERFFTSRSDGTGLGLYMVQQIITKGHHGQIWFETSPSGTTFYIKLPRSPDRAADGCWQEHEPCTTTLTAIKPETGIAPGLFSASYTA